MGLPVNFLEKSRQKIINRSTQFFILVVSSSVIVHPVRYYRMKHNYLLVCLLMLLSFAGVGQSISLQETYSSLRCASSVMSVSFTTSGTFAAGNTFRVQLSANYGSTYVDLPGSFTSSPASVTLPAGFSLNTFYVYRVVADKPLTISNSSSSFRISNVPAAELTGSTAGNTPINPYEIAYLRMAVTGGATYTLTMQDSTRYVKSEDYTSSSDFPVLPAQTTTYRLASVRNGCGSGPVSGSATVLVNPVGFQLLSRPNVAFCLGSQLPVYFSTSGPLPANTVFEAELISTYDGNRSISVPVSGSVSPLLVSLPKQHLGNSSSGYQLRVYAKAAGLSAWFSDGGTFTLGSPPRFSLVASPSSIPFGGQSSLVLSYTTASSGDIFLSNGQVYTSYGGSGFVTQFTVNPTATTSYSITNYTGACVDGATYAAGTAAVQVRPGIRIDSLSAKEVCSGQPVTIYYTASPGYKLPGGLIVQYGNGYSADAIAVKSGELVFTPVTSLAFQNQPIRVVDAADTLRMQTNWPLSLKTKPTLRITREDQSLTNPGDASLETIFFGGGTTQVLFNTGARTVLTGGYLQTYTAYTYLPIYVTGTTTFSVVSLSNECGVGSGIGKATVTVQNTPGQQAGITIKPTDSNRSASCPGSREWINVFPTGTFNADNQFQLEVSGANGVFGGTSVQSLSSTGAQSVVLPTAPGTYRVRVSSTSPITRSNEQAYSLYGAPSASASISLPGTNSFGSLTAVSGQVINATYSFFNGRSPYQYELANGAKGQSDYGFQTTYQPTASTNYGVVRVTDACGVAATINNNLSTVVVVPSVLQTRSINASQVCVQTPLLMPFVQFGSVPASASYIAQVSEDRITWETVPTSGAASPLTVVLPASLANKLVYYRVAYLAGGVLVPGVRYDDRVQVRTTPNTVLSAPNNTSVVQIDRNSFFSAEIKLTDLSSQGTVVVASGLNALRLSASAIGSTYYISQPGTYSIVSAYNSCGYGQGQGTVRAVLKPYLSLAQANRTTACIGQTVSFSYAVAGDFDAGNKLSVYLINNYDNTSVKTLLSENAPLSGVVSFSLSPALPSSSYRIQVDASAPLTTFNGANLVVDAPVSATLSTGAKVVYAGDSPEVLIRSNAVGPYSLTLATPTGPAVVTGASFSTYYFPLKITQSGSYSIAAVANQCGAGRVTGVVSVTAIPLSTVTIRPFLFTSSYCTGKQYIVDINTTGVFSTTNTFTAYVTDSTGTNVRALPTVSTPTRLTITIPADLPNDGRYIFRIGSSTPQHLGASSNQFFAVEQTPTGTLTGNASIIKGDSTRISVALTGTAPWQFVVTDFFGPRTFVASQTPYTLTVRPDTTIGYRLTEVRNAQCGVGTATGTALVTVTKILATEPALPLQVRTWPNPTAGTLLVEGEVPGRGDVRLMLHTVSGTLVSESVGGVRQGRLNHRLELGQLPAGIYLLTAEQEGRRSQFKVLKQ